MTTVSKANTARLQEAEAAMYRLRSTFKVGQNRYGEYGTNCRLAFEGWAKIYSEITGMSAPHIYD